jgi:hypothetical protein
MKAVCALAVFACATADNSPVLEKLRMLEMSIRNEIAALKAEHAGEISALRSQLNTAAGFPDGALLAFADGRAACPEGWFEPQHLKGRMMTTIPINATSGATFNRPFDAGEQGRTPTHSHDVTVTDPGHNHVQLVNDPGHAHSIVEYWPKGTSGAMLGKVHFANTPETKNTSLSKTGISIESLPAKSAVSVSVDANEAGEHYPLVYVLVCQKKRP